MGRPRDAAVEVEAWVMQSKWGPIRAKKATRACSSDCSEGGETGQTMAVNSHNQKRKREQGGARERGGEKGGERETKGNRMM